ncbi:MAG TPA: cell division protein FtsH, partial [Flexilinea sp.]|nr:cell division protein FtsH [Flexilinea sp.]
ANVMNEAALLAARRNGNSVNMDDFELAIERIVAGLEKKTRVMNEKERTAVAYHESGHALIGEIVPNGDPVAKVSIVPRGRGALGYTMQMPTEDRYLMTQSELEDKIAVLLGGRAAESIIFNEISTGAADDIKKATELARRMVTEFGMSEKLGVVRYATPQYQFLESYETAAVASPETLKLIDEEVQRILDEQFKRVINLLNENRDALESLTKLLLEKETISGEEVKEAIAKQRIKEPAIV